MGTLDIIANIVGVIATILYVLCYQQKTRVGIIAMNVTSRALYVTQYLLLGAFSGAVFDMMGIVIGILAAKRDTPFIRRFMIPLIVVTNLILAGAMLLTWEGPLSLFAYIGVTLHTLALWLKKEKAIRWLSFIGQPFWLVYNAANLAFGSVIGDVISLGSMLVALWRYRQKPAEKIKGD